MPRSRGLKQLEAGSLPLEARHWQQGPETELMMLPGCCCHAAAMAHINSHLGCLATPSDMQGLLSGAVHGPAILLPNAVSLKRRLKHHKVVTAAKNHSAFCFYEHFDMSSKGNCCSHLNWCMRVAQGLHNAALGTLQKAR